MKKTKTLLVIIFISALVMLSCFSTAAAADGYYPEISSENAIVVYSIESGQTLYSYRSDEKTAPTAATKLLTMMVVYDLFSEHDIDYKTLRITVTQESISGIGNLGDISAPRLGLTAGKDYLAEDLMGASLVGNANDACNVLAYYCATEFLGGNIGAFFARMNQKAEALGTTDSVFKNATGLDQSGMVTTPKDVALIAAGFYKYNELFIMSNRSLMKFNITGTVHAKNYLLSDALISKYKMNQAKGIIAGQRDVNGDYTLITAVEKDGLTYIIVVMNASGELRTTDGLRSFGDGNAYDDMKILIPWTQNSFEYRILSEKEGEPVAELRVAMGKSYDHVKVIPQSKLELLINKSVESSQIERKISFDESIVYKGDYNGTVVDMVDAPIVKGQEVGTLTFLYNGEVLGSVKLIAQSSVDASGLLSTANTVKGFLFGSTMRTILLGFAGIIALYILFSIVTSVIRGIKRIKKATTGRKSNKEDDSF
ncbi:MAG: hypothetical protein CVU97_00355 [Firmicutes bacterium HGW-Firmicutes-21]|nr:MAG: hypothetical protein CVU97_00355 [Firmicutes bacterium HGW-Firmicutes-21]